MEVEVELKLELKLEFELELELELELDLDWIWIVMIWSHILVSVLIEMDRVVVHNCKGILAIARKVLRPSPINQYSLNA